MQQLNKIVVSKNAFESSDTFRLIESNISVVNILREEGIDIESIHPDATSSFYVDFYLAQYNNGNFSQFVWNTQWSSELNAKISSSLKKIGAEKHLQLFIEQCEKVDNLPDGELEKYINSEYFGYNPTRDALKNDVFYDLIRTEDLIWLNSQWLRNHPDLLVLEIDQMFDEIEKFLGRKIQR
ncbi:hypothetical protein F889_02399 [Acinetobacter colistiniresistens]|uniref:DNA mimic protein DMP19 C-terminal domain-containing protein n=1 Tax=Acinetobacter colistiniresistens TaxID=280145 RepID=N9QUJ7_9GAMM|nr:hypothetical protein [Acinetobacter colistiniresistens]ENX33736.1 hypothetical protein F889_02399 [Acinetobacter colistiniresistens]